MRTSTWVTGKGRKDDNGTQKVVKAEDEGRRKKAQRLRGRIVI